MLGIVITCPRCGNGAQPLKDIFEETRDSRFAPPGYDRFKFALIIVAAIFYLISFILWELQSYTNLGGFLFVIGSIIAIFCRDKTLHKRLEIWNRSYFCLKCDQIFVLE